MGNNSRSHMSRKWLNLAEGFNPNALLTNASPYLFHWDSGQPILEIFLQLEVRKISVLSHMCHFLKISPSFSLKHSHYFSLQRTVPLSLSLSLSLSFSLYQNVRLRLPLKGPLCASHWQSMTSGSPYYTYIQTWNNTWNYCDIVEQKSGQISIWNSFSFHFKRDLFSNYQRTRHLFKIGEWTRIKMNNNSPFKA